MRATLADSPLSSLGLEEFLTAMAGERPDPAAGSAAAVAAAMGAALVAKAARLSRRHTDEADELVARADDLRLRAVDLAEADAGVVASMHAKVAAASSEGSRGSEERRSVDDASAVPRDIGALAREVAALADHLHEHGNPRLRADAEAARELARAADLTAEAIVRSNEGRREQ